MLFVCHLDLNWTEIVQGYGFFPLALTVLTLQDFSQLLRATVMEISDLTEYLAIKFQTYKLRTGRPTSTL